MAHKNFPDDRTLPAPITGSEAGSFAYSTVTVRLPDIARRVIAENDFSPEIVKNLETLIDEINNGFVRLLQDDEGLDLKAWESYLQPHFGKSWLEIPWYLAEAYFYRRILESTHYFQPGIWQGIDPFEYQKRLGLETTIDVINRMILLLDEWRKSEFEDIESQKKNLVNLLSLDLWGNRADLSLWPAGEAEKKRVESNREKAYILVDDSDNIAQKIIDFDRVRIDFIVDNSGLELMGDLCLADFLLSTHKAEVVHLHLKAHPTFVSDAMIKDVRYTIEWLLQTSNPAMPAFGLRLQNYIDRGHLILQENLFWTSPLAFWEMPDALERELSQSQLIFIKGDANYRRSIGDRHWPFTTDYKHIVSYFPAPLVALRTLKSELATSLTSEQIKTLPDRDSNWLTNGRWGVIQLVDRT